MKEKIRSFRDLNIWKLGIEIIEEVYKATRVFPKDELYTLASQMKRCAVSIPSNVAEGFARKYNKEYKQFLYITLGSCAELETQIEIAFKLKYITEEKRRGLLDKVNHVTRMTMNLLKRL